MIQPVLLDSTDFDRIFGQLCACLNGSSVIQIPANEGQSFLDEVLKLVMCERDFLRVRPYAQQLGQSDKLTVVAQRIGISPEDNLTGEPFPAQFL